MVLLLWVYPVICFFIKSTFSLYVLEDADQFVFLLLGGIFLYDLVLSNSSSFLWYSTFSIITKKTPLSVINMTLLLSSLSSLGVWYSVLDMFDSGLEEHCAFFRAFFTSNLISSASPLFNLEQACSTATTYSPTGGCLGLMENFGPWAKSLSWSSVNGVFDRFLTHFFVSSVMVSSISLFI